MTDLFGPLCLNHLAEPGFINLWGNLFCGGTRLRAKEGARSFILLAQPALLPSVISSFFTQNKGGGGGGLPPRSATAFSGEGPHCRF